MWPTYYLYESIRLASDREAAERRRGQVLDELPAEPRPSRVRRGVARLALAVSRQSLRLAETLDECAADSSGARPARVG
jgi:hypothetical protein